MSAGAVLQAGVVARLADVLDCAVFDAPPVRAAIPHAVVEDPVLGDWSSATWRGREGRLVVSLHDGGERPVRLRAALGAAERWDAVPAPVAQGVAMLAAHLFDHRESDALPPAAVAALWRPYRRMRLSPEVTA